MYPGGTTALYAYPKNFAGVQLQPASTDTVDLSSSNTNVATVASTSLSSATQQVGTITAVAAGTTSICVTYNGKSACNTLTVFPNTQLSVTSFGPATVSDTGMHTWTVNVSGGNGQLDYYWYKYPGGPTLLHQTTSSLTSTYSQFVDFDASYYICVRIESGNAAAQNCSSLSTPPHPLSAMITGPSMVTIGDVNTWTAGASYGTAPYTYQWTGPFQGSGSTISGSLSQDDYIFLLVTDATGTQASATLFVKACSGFSC